VYVKVRGDDEMTQRELQRGNQRRDLLRPPLSHLIYTHAVELLVNSLSLFTLTVCFALTISRHNAIMVAKHQHRSPNVFQSNISLMATGRRDRSGKEVDVREGS
jgi:hypothetical protein